jgi:quercetin dioxygenase-like cupin family protein
MEPLIKNMPREEVTTLTDLVAVQEGQVVSRTLAQNDHLSLTLFSFDKGEEISTHASEGDALVTVLTGEGTFTVNGTPHIVKAGESLLMPAGLPHSIKAVNMPFQWQLTVVFPEE